MKKIILSALLSIFFLSLSAQEIWNEGATWKIGYNYETDSYSEIYTLLSPIRLDDDEYYFPMTLLKDNECDTVAYIGADNEDDTIYVRAIIDGKLTPAYRLYVFDDNCFRGGSVEYSVYNDSTVSYHKLDIPRNYDLKYAKSEDGREFPIYNGIIYQLGHKMGPLYFFLGKFEDYPFDGPGEKGPKVSNVSHLLFGSKNGYEINAEIYDEDMNLCDTYSYFGFKLFSETDNSHKNSNVVFSPFSAQNALSMLMNGAENNTLYEIKNVMNISGFTEDYINDYNREVRTNIESLMAIRNVSVNKGGIMPSERTDTTICVRVANSIWAKEGTHCNEDFISKNKTFYDAEFSTINLANQDTISKYIDTWIKDKTRNTIKSAGVEANELLEMVLTNALYFKGYWEFPFDAKSTNNEVFCNIDGSSVSIPMMNKKGYLYYYKNKYFRAVKLPYGDGSISMGIFLANIDGLESDDESSNLNYNDWAYYMNRSISKKVELKLPKFNVECDLDLKENLSSMGIIEAFNDNADFSRMYDGPSKVDRMKQKIYLSVDEEGTEAAVTTIQETACSSEEPEEIEQFYVNRPFYFTIEDNTTNTILFVGHIKSLNESSTNISDIIALSSEDTIYDLQGRRLNTIPQKGIYISKGKKIVVTQ